MAPQHMSSSSSGPSSDPIEEEPKLGANEGDDDDEGHRGTGSQSGGNDGSSARDQTTRRLPASRPRKLVSPEGSPTLADNLFPHGSGYYPPTPDASQPTSRTASGSSSKSAVAKSTSSGSVSSLAPVQESLEDSRVTPTKYFERWWIGQDGSVEGQQTRQWSLDLRKVAVEAFRTADWEILFKGVGQQFRVVARGCRAFLVSGGNIEAGAGDTIDFSGCCEAAEVVPQAHACLCAAGLLCLALVPGGRGDLCRALVKF